MKQFLLLIITVSLLFVAGVSLVFSGSFYQALESAEALELIMVISSALIITTFLFGLVTSDYSWVDRLWSIAPVVFAWIYAMKAPVSPVIWVPLLIITLWGLRLSFNFARRGGYTGMEDYRWPILREKIGNEWLWQLFSLLFVSGFQISLFILFTSPLIMLMDNGVPGAQFSSIPPIGMAALLWMIICLVLETLADQQQWDFHHAKALWKKADTQLSREDAEWLKNYPWKEDVERGFISSGLFSLVRHPNYLGELGFWWGLYIFAASVRGEMFHWSFVGVFLLSILFIGSTRFTESITAAKYPAYKVFQGSTPAIVPISIGKSDSVVKDKT